MEKYNSKNNPKYFRQQSIIKFYTEVLCQDIESIPKANDWIDSQKEIHYLPKSDIFAYYCPMCNATLVYNKKCERCNQAIEWSEEMQPKLIE